MKKLPLIILFLVSNLAWADIRPRQIPLDQLQSEENLVLVLQNLNQQTTIPRCDFVPVIDADKKQTTMVMKDGKAYLVYVNTCALGFHLP